jgi:hypothetical protein
LDLALGKKGAAVLISKGKERAGLESRQRWGSVGYRGEKKKVIPSGMREE